MDYDDTGKLLLRLTVGGMLILHGIHKIMIFPAGISGMLEAHGIPGSLVYGVYLGEILGPVLVIVGLYARIGGLLIFLNMVVATYLAFGGNVLAVNSHGGWIIELEAFYGLGGLAIMLLGAGGISLGGRYARLN